MQEITGTISNIARTDLPEGAERRDVFETGGGEALFEVGLVDAFRGTQLRKAGIVVAQFRIDYAQ